MNMDQHDFDHFRQFLQEASGICLAQNKQYLVSTRIRRILSENEVPSLGQLIDNLRSNRNSALREHVIDAMTTNETYWFRDGYPFEYLKTSLLRELQVQQDSSIRIWSAACSSGQEPYSIAMAIEEFQRQSFGSNKKQISILASDLSTSMMKQAVEGVYDKLSIARGLSRERLERHFIPLGGDNWQVKPQIKNRIEYRVVNMLDSYSNLGRFDIIFCRNVLIYFSHELKQSILKRLHAALKPGGYLCLGSSEGLGDSMNLFDMVNCNPGIIYRAR